MRAQIIRTERRIVRAVCSVFMQRDNEITKEKGTLLALEPTTGLDRRRY